jgi:hypothetical protein
MTTQRIGPWRLPARALCAAGLAAGMVFGIGGAQAANKEPIGVGVIAPFSAIDGASIINGAELAVEKTDYVGTFGRVEFYGPKAKYAHGMKYGKGYVTGTMFQWQNGKQVPIWPTQAATAKPELALLKK